MYMCLIQKHIHNRKRRKYLTRLYDCHTCNNNFSPIKICYFVCYFAYAIHLFLISVVYLDILPPRMRVSMQVALINELNARKGRTIDRGVASSALVQSFLLLAACHARDDDTR
jgi:hypothetical protein